MERTRVLSQAIPRIRDVENSSFTSLVLSSVGGMAREARIFYKRLASLLAEKWDQSYSTTMDWLRCTLSHSLLIDLSFSVFAAIVRPTATP